VVDTNESTRQLKVSRLVQKELADIFLRKGMEFVHGKMVSVTKVRITPDLSYAKVYLSIFPSEAQEEALKSIQLHTGKIRYDLGTRIRKQLRIVPEISFFIDDSLDYIDNIEKLLNT